MVGHLLGVATPVAMLPHAVTPSQAPAVRAVTGRLARSGGGNSSSEKLRILCYGDSLTAGLHDHGKRYSPYGKALKGALLALGVQCEVSICGLSGYRTDEMIAHLRAPACRDHFGKVGRGLAHILDSEGHFDLVILMAGTNDFTPNSDLRAIQGRVCELHSVCHARGVPTVMLSAPCNTSNLRIGLGKLLCGWAQGHSQVLDFVDPEELVPRRHRAHWESDCVHFSPAGYHALGMQLAPRIADVLKKLGERPGAITNLAFSVRKGSHALHKKGPSRVQQLTPGARLHVIACGGA